MILGRLRSQVREEGWSIVSIEPILVVFISESVIPERKVNIATGERAMFGLVAAAQDLWQPCLLRGCRARTQRLLKSEIFFVSNDILLEFSVWTKSRHCQRQKCGVWFGRHSVIPRSSTNLLVLRLSYFWQPPTIVLLYYNHYYNHYCSFIGNWSLNLATTRCYRFSTNLFSPPLYS